MGPENFFLFGLTAEEIASWKDRGYDPRVCYKENEELREAIDLVRSGFFPRGDRGLFQPLTDALLTRDAYFLLADYSSYRDTQEKAGQAYLDQDSWTRGSILNVARMGRFSSDRSIQEYREKIWKVDALKIG